MTTIALPKTEVDIVQKNGEVLTVCLLDLHYEIISAMEPVLNATTKVRMQAVADSINNSYDTELTWGEAAYILEEITDSLDELKKNSSDTPT